jgi:hypothetical protein
LPRPKVASREDLHRWIWSEVGESADFAAGALDTHEFPEMEGTAVYAGAPGAVLFSITMWNRDLTPNRSIEIAIEAKVDDPFHGPETEIHLQRPSGWIGFRARPRSERLTRFLVHNAVNAISTRTPSKLLYSPQSLLAAKFLIVSSVESIVLA